MHIAPDGSPVELYERLPALGEGALVEAALPPPATVLELGCGTGRMTRQLVARGYRVTAVDESPEMLAHVSGAETGCASIEALDLQRTFDVVLLASNLLSVEPARRRTFLETCRRHGGLVVVETLPVGWRPNEGETRIGDVTSRLRLDAFDGRLAVGEVEYEAGGRRWSHAFEMHVFATEEELRAALAEGGLELDRWLDETRGWFCARASAGGGPP